MNISDFNRNLLDYALSFIGHETAKASLRSISLPQVELLKYSDVKRLKLTRSRLLRQDHVAGKFSFITLDGEQLREWSGNGDGKYCASRSCRADEIAAPRLYVACDEDVCGSPASLVRY